MSDDRADWRDRNQTWLVLAIEALRDRLRRAGEGDIAEPPALAAERAAARAAMDEPPALEAIAAALGLTAFETSLLLLCAAHELAGDIGALCAAAGDGNAWPSFGLALAVLPLPAWNALSASGPLRRWRLLHRVEGGGLAAARLSIDERVLDALLGLDAVDQRLAAARLPERLPERLFDSENAAATEAAAGIVGNGADPLVQLVGGRAGARLAVAQEAARGIGATLLPLSAASLLAGDAERDLRLVEREYRLAGRLPMIDAADLAPPDAARLDRLLHSMVTPLILGVETPRRLDHRASRLVEMPGIRIAERVALWHAVAGPEADAPALARLSVQFPLPAGDIAAHAERWRREDGADPARLWAICREAARPALDALAKRIEPRATWDELVLPTATLTPLRAFVAQAEARARVHGDWGFAARGGGLGLAALFAGSSGTGKTMAAEVIANALSLDLFRVDLSQIVSKYIGETEKHLRALFDAAEDGGAILLFDEADALFGRRSEVKDSHDRYGNVEVSYLLQRLETYTGIAILTTNMKSSIDEAFLRRLRFIVDFDFPDEADRARLWATIFPPDTPTEGLDAVRLARLAIGGGVARNIALTAAFAAAERDEPIRMTHLAEAARREYRKLGRTPGRMEMEGWDDA